MYQGGSDDFLGPTDDAVFASEDWGIDFEAEIAVVTGDVAMGADADAALDGVRLLMLVNDWSLRHLIPAELAKGFGFLQSKPATAFGPVAVTPDELGEAWQGGRVHLNAGVRWNGSVWACVDAGPEMSFHFGQLIAHLAKTRQVRAGSIVGSGTVSNKDWARGYACIAEKRAIETIEHGEPTHRLHAVRRHDPHRDEGPRRPERVRRHRAEAEQLQLEPEAQVRSSTAGGVVQGYVARVDIELEGGVHVRRLPVTVLPALERPLLGMDILSKMRFSQQSGVLRIEPGTGARP
jgi:hypothetical protein